MNLLSQIATREEVAAILNILEAGEQHQETAVDDSDLKEEEDEEEDMVEVHLDDDPSMLSSSATRAIPSSSLVNEEKGGGIETGSSFDRRVPLDMDPDTVDAMATYEMCVGRVRIQL